jgi:hypothetical protein
VTVVTGASNSKSFDFALARSVRRGGRIEEKAGERFARDDK